ncbi:ATP-dependent helicase [Bacillus cereus]|nr:ATP-dependent helicase [Bacillus cereus]
MLKKESNFPKYIMDSEDLKGNPEQMLVYNSSGNCIVLAGPGSGKTKTLTIKMARMLNEDIREPQGIACITYNKECARELKHRLGKLGVYENKRVIIDTVHSFCLNNVIKPFFRLTNIRIPEPIKVASKAQQSKLWEESFNFTIGLRERLTGGWKTDATVYRRTYLDRNSNEWKEGNSELATWIEDYENLLRQEGLIDFDDMVLLGLRIIEQNDWVRDILKAKFPIIIVDEYQDLGLPLHRIIKSLCFKSDIRLLAVGDPDQSIYGFTGANPQLLKELSEMENVSTVPLQMNYRSSEKIVKASQIALGESRDFKSANKKITGMINFYEYPKGIEDQAEKICTEIIPDILQRNPSSKLGDIAVLYLDKYDGNIIAEKVTAHKLNYIRMDQNAPYSKTPLTRWLEDCAAWCSTGWEFGNPKLSNLIKAWEMFIKNSRISDKELLVLKRGFLEFLWDQRNPDIKLFDWLKLFYNAVLKQIFELGQDLKDEMEEFKKLINESAKGRMLNFTVASFAGQSGSPEHLNLITLHSAKGLEFTYVIMMGMEEGRIPYLRASDTQKRESRRLFYVGFTRAKQEVHLTYSGWYRYYEYINSHGPSQYVLELQNRI